jgi:type IV pilus assembly protein PilE
MPGFTLIELMITVAVIAILAAIAYPSYTEYVARGRRADTKTVIQEAAQALERRYTECGGYNRKADCAAAANMGEALPTSLQSSPKEGATKWYQMDTASGKTAVAATTFTLIFKPQGSQATDKCGSFSLTNTGAKTVVDKPTGSTATVDDCWNR